jgi:hypothetical protein
MQAARNHVHKLAVSLSKELGTVAYFSLHNMYPVAPPFESISLFNHQFLCTESCLHHDALFLFHRIPFITHASDRRLRDTREKHLAEVETLKAEVEHLKAEVYRKNRSLQSALEAMDAGDAVRLVLHAVYIDHGGTFSYRASQ